MDKPYEACMRHGRFFCCREGHQRTTTMVNMCASRASASAHTCRTYSSRRNTCLRFGALVGSARITTPTPSCLCLSLSSTSHSRPTATTPSSRPREEGKASPGRAPREEDIAPCYFGMSANDTELRPRSRWLISTGRSRSSSVGGANCTRASLPPCYKLRPRRSSECRSM
jgi:hypothetical protein